MPSDISREAILQGLNTRFIGNNVLYYQSIPSTMDIAKQAAKEGASEGTIIVAEKQTKGKGRLGRTWINPQGVIALSVILRPTMDDLLRLTMVASLATSLAIEKATGLYTTIKWPNDVLIKGKKVSGILTQSALKKQYVDWAVIGIGINVNFDPNSYPEIAYSATSISNELGREFSELKILLHLLYEIETYYTSLLKGHPIHEEWQSRLETLGKHVRVKTEKDILEGLAESVDADGALLLRLENGILMCITAGDVTLHA